jgi:uncharacterized membrane protein YhhN
MSNWVFCAFSEFKDSFQAKMRIQAKIDSIPLSFRMTLICSLGLLITLLFGVSQFTSSVFWLLVGLTASVIASCLLISQRYSRLGYIAFLVGLSAYSVGFLTQLSGTVDWWLLSSLAAFGIVVFFLLLPKIESLFMPVGLMGSMILLLIWSAGELWLRSHSLSSLLALLGAVILFIAAIASTLIDDDIVLPTDSPLLNGAYILSQGLIVASALL